VNERAAWALVIVAAALSGFVVYREVKARQGAQPPGLDPLRDPPMGGVKNTDADLAQTPTGERAQVLTTEQLSGFRQGLPGFRLRPELPTRRAAEQLMREEPLSRNPQQTLTEAR